MNNQEKAMHLLAEAGKLTWWYLNANFPWRPEVYKNEQGVPNQLMITGDGVIMLRLDVVDLDKFDTFAIKVLQPSDSGWKYYEAHPDFIEYVQKVLKLPAKESIVGKKLSLDQLVEVLVLNSKKGTNGRNTS